MLPTASAKGILRPRDAARHIDLRRYPATGPIGRYVERFWAVPWDLRDRTVPMRDGADREPIALNLAELAGRLRPQPAAQEVQA